MHLLSKNLNSPAYDTLIRVKRAKKNIMTTIVPSMLDV